MDINDLIEKINNSDIDIRIHPHIVCINSEIQTYSIIVEGDSDYGLFELIDNPGCCQNKDIVKVYNIYNKLMKLKVFW